MERAQNYKPMLDEDEELRIEKMRRAEEGGIITNKQNVIPASQPVSLQERYHHKGINSVYYIKPESKEIYLLDFKQRRFNAEYLKMDKPVPKSATSV